MARRRKNLAGEAALLVIGGVVAAIAAIPKEAWIVLGVLGAICLVIWLLKGSKEDDAGRADHPASSNSDFEPYVTVRVSSQGRSRIAEELRGDPVPAQWTPKGRTVQVGNWVIKGGMLYVGSDLRAPNGEIDPALIEPRARISKRAAHCSQRQADYWPSYSTISPEARATYLSWLASGRNDPTADIGYVFLYFYGLERRALIDAREDPVARDELPQIEAEVARLLDVYGGNRSFDGYAGSFLEFLECQRMNMSINAWSPPDVTAKRGDLPLAMKIGLGKFAKSGALLPSNWAFAWAKWDCRIGSPKAMERCPSEFEKLFTHRYTAAFGKGMKLPLNRTKLQIAYKPASAGFAGQVMAPIPESLPDVTAVIAPIKKLEAIVEECAEDLAPYSRFLGKDPSGAGTLDGNLLLPRLLWPESAQTALDELDKRIGDGLRVMTLGELSTTLGGGGNLTRNKARALAHALQEMRIGIEPDILAGARTPKADDKIILFRSDPEDASQRESNVYRAASVSLDLACSVAMADGKPHPSELQLLMKQIDGWAHLSTAQRKRLRARLRMALESPPTLASLRSKLEVIPADGKRAIAHLMATLAQADGVVAPTEVKLLERIYKVLGLDTKAVYGDLHIQSLEAASPGTSRPLAPPGSSSADTVEAPPSGRLNLDVARIAALQRETAEVSALLSNVFAEETSVSEEQKEERDEASSIIEPGPLGLDPEHSVFLRLIMTRDSWSRRDLADAASDMELMFDGAIERINEAAFEHLDAPLLEGDDPIEVVRDVMERVTA